MQKTNFGFENMVPRTLTPFIAVVFQSFSLAQVFLTPWTEAYLCGPSLATGVCSNSHPLSQWCHPTISSSVTPFSFPQSLPVSGSFPMSWLFELGGQSIGTSVPAWVLPVNIQGWFPLGLTGLLLGVKCHTRCFPYAFPSNPSCQHGSQVLVPWCSKHEMLSIIRGI